MGAVQGVALWKATHALPAALVKQRPRLARRQDELAVLRIASAAAARGRRASSMSRGRPAHAPPGDRPLGGVDALDVARLVEGKMSRTSRCRQAHSRRHQATVSPCGASPPVPCLLEGQRDGPGVMLALVLDRLLVQNAVEGGRSIGPVSGLRPPSPRRYSVDRSASLTGTRLRLARAGAELRDLPAGTLRLIGSLRPPWGAIRSASVHSKSSQWSVVSGQWSEVGGH